jgi:hypothetical protein
LAGYEPLPGGGLRPLALEEVARLRRGGENALHIAVINQREDWILSVLGAIGEADDSAPSAGRAAADGASGALRGAAAKEQVGARHPETPTE